MSNAKFSWWSSAIRMVINYPEWKRQYDDMHTQSCVAEMTGMPHSGNVSRTTENVAMMQLPRAIQNEYDAVCRAIEVTLMLPEGERRVELIRRVYWCGKKMRIQDVAPALYVSEATGWRWHGDFIRLAADYAGYM